MQSRVSGDGENRKPWRQRGRRKLVNRGAVEFVAQGSQRLHRLQRLSTTDVQEIQNKRDRIPRFSTEFNGLLSTALGAGGRRFKSSRPDSLIQRDTARFGMSPERAVDVLYIISSAEHRHVSRCDAHGAWLVSRNTNLRPTRYSFYFDPSPTSVIVPKKPIIISSQV
jgi:hypothetical protein